MSSPNKPTRETPAARRVVVTASGKPRQFEMGGRSVTFVPLAIKRRHSSELIVPPVGAVSEKVTSSFDLPVIRTLGKAFYWQKVIDAGEMANASESKWWRGGGSNSRPSHCERDALPAELPPHESQILREAAMDPGRCSRPPKARYRA